MTEVFSIASAGSQDSVDPAFGASAVAVAIHIAQVRTAGKAQSLEHGPKMERGGSPKLTLSMVELYGHKDCSVDLFRTLRYCC